MGTLSLYSLNIKTRQDANMYYTKNKRQTELKPSVGFDLRAVN